MTWIFIVFASHVTFRNHDNNQVEELPYIQNMVVIINSVKLIHCHDETKAGRLFVVQMCVEKIVINSTVTMILRVSISLDNNFWKTDLWTSLYNMLEHYNLDLV